MTTEYQKEQCEIGGMIPMKHLHVVHETKARHMAIYMHKRLHLQRLLYL